jgi:hypothetical protein
MVSLIVFIACSKSINSSTATTSNPNNIPANITVTASLQGRVVDENGVPVQGAAVSSGTATATTDVNGLFSFRNISMSSRFGYVQAVKSGYFTGSRSIITGPGSSNYISIELKPRTLTGTFPAPSGGKIALQTGDTASFSAASVVTASTNAAYTGTVYVYAEYLDPTDSNLYKYMPGDLRGIGLNGYETDLQSFGMMDVEMQDGAGNKLQLAGGQTATLTWAIPQALQASATATIPLWYFNDTTGQWLQQGTATREGNNYVGQVGHFTFWNCDAPIGTVNFSVYLKDQHGNPLPYTYVEFQSAAYGTRGGYTDSTGHASGLIPKGQNLLMEVMTECGSLIGGFNVGPAVTDQNLGTVTVNIIMADLTLTGTVVDCSNNPVDSGFVTAKVDGLNYAAVVSNGTFTLPVVRCFSSSTSVMLLAGNYQTSQTGNPVTITADSGLVNVGQLSACGIVLVQYINFTWNGISHSFDNLPDSINTFSFEGIRPGVYAFTTSGTSENLTLAFASLNLGTVSLTNFYYQISGANGITGSGGTATLTEYDSFAVGTFGGNMYDSISLNTYPLTGNFKIKLTP